MIEKIEKAKQVAKLYEELTNLYYTVDYITAVINLVVSKNNNLLDINKCIDILHKDYIKLNNSPIFKFTKGTKIYEN